ncbi:MAG: transporter substrate-binding domain-containing protein, partial [Desulfobacterales bacterium]|nr:transporter substrate-binding domain-containing protein [Desulfobacterales bacterium]
DSGQDLSGRTIALEKGGDNVRLFRENYPLTTVREYPGAAEALGAVSLGEADAYAGNRAVAMYLLEKELLFDLVVRGRMENSPVRLSIGVRKDLPILVRILDLALADISREEVRTIHRRWMGEYKALELRLTREERAWLAEHPVIRVTSEPDYPPFDFRVDGEPAGYSIDLVKLLAERLGVRLEFVRDTWGNLLKKAENKEVDLVHSIFKFPVERERYLAFTRPYKEVFNVIVTRDDVQGVRELKDLVERRVALVKGDSLVDLVQKAAPAIQIVYFDNYAEALKSVAVGKTDATLTELPTATHYLRALSLMNLRIVAKTEALEGRDQRYRLAVRKDWAILADILNKALNSLTGEERGKLEKKWLTRPGWPGVVEKPAPEVNLSAKELAWIEAHPVLRVTNEPDWPPYDYNEAGKPTGFSIDYLNLLAAKVGVRLEYATASWAGLLNRIKRRESDIIHSLNISEERRKYMKFTAPYLTLSNAAVVRKTEEDISSLKQLYDKTLAVGEGWTTLDIVRKSHPRIKIYMVKNALEGLKAVQFGKADAWIDVYGASRYLIDQHFLTNLKICGDIEDVGPLTFHVAVRGDWPILRDILQKGMASISVREKETLLEKWRLYSAAASTRPRLSEEEKKWLADNPVIRLGHDIDYPPVEYIDEDGRYQGMSAEYMELIAEILGVTIEPAAPQSWQATIEAARARRVDILSAAARTPQREEYLRFTEPYLSFPMVIVTDQDVSYIGDMREIAD